MIVAVSDIWIDHGSNVSRDPINPETCQVLAATIEQHGQLTSVLLTDTDNPDYKYKLVCGYRRMVAMAGILGWTEVRADFEAGISEERAAILNTIENLEREDLDFWSQCKTMKRAFPEGTSESEISRQLSRSRTWVRARWLIWKMPQEVIDQVEQGLFTSTQVNLLVQKSYEEQVAAAAALKAGIDAGETTNSMLPKFSRRKSIRSKKDIQATMTQLMDMDNMNGVHALRYAIGDISDTQLFELLS